MGKILLVSNMYPSDKYPHYGVFVKHCEELLRRQGHEVDCVVLKKQDGKLKKLLAYLSFYARTLKCGLRGDHDCIYAHYASHVLPVVALLRRFRPGLYIVTNVHGNDIVPVTPEEEKNPAHSKKTMDLSDLVVAPSAYFKQVLCENYQIPPEKIITFPSGGVDRTVFIPDGNKDRKCSLKGKKEITVGCIARLEETKGWDVFLNAVPLMAKRHPDWKFVLVGDGSRRAVCEQQLRESGCEDKVSLTGMLSQEKLAARTNQMDILCVPSMQESLGLVGLEGMSCGVPCVISAIPGMLSYARDGENCLTFAPGDAQALADAVEKMYKLPDEDRKKILEQQLATAESYNKDNLGQNLEGLFRNRKKRVLIVNQGKTDNFGDQAIARAAASAFRENGFLVEEAGYDMARSIPWEQPTEGSESGGGVDLPLRLKWILKKKRELHREQAKLKRSWDALVIGGGQLIKSDCYFPYALKEWAVFGHRYAARQYLLGVGVDHVLKPQDQRSFQKILRKFDGIYVRDRQSLKKLKEEMSVPAQLIPDLAFLLNHSLQQIDVSRADYTAVNIYHYQTYKSHQKGTQSRGEYYGKWKGYVDAELKMGNKVLLGYTAQEDFRETQEFYEAFRTEWGERVAVAQIRSLDELIDMLSRAGKVYSARMHALILSVMLHKPIVCDEISDKLKSFRCDYVESGRTADQAEQEAMNVIRSLGREI